MTLEKGTVWGREDRMIRWSDVIPWLFVGPLLVAIISNLAYQITQIGWVANVAMVATCLAALALLVAAAPAINVLFWKRPSGSKDREEESNPTGNDSKDEER